MDFQRPAEVMSETQARILDAIHPAEHDPYTYICENGVKLTLQKVPSSIAMDIGKKFPEPIIPMFMDETAGRLRENLDDPAYHKEIQDRNINVSILTVNLYFGMGTKVLFVPDDVESFEGAEWVEALEVLSDGAIVVPTSKRARYVTWLRYVVLADRELQTLINAIQHISGATLEEEVAPMYATFPQSSETAGNTTNGVYPTNES